MKISKEQEAIINAPISEKTVVIATPAAGKTFCLTERLRTLVKNGVDPERIVAITFTNNAAAEMRARLGNDFKQGMYIGTIHGYANNLLVSHNIDTSEIINDEEFDEFFNLITLYPEVINPVDYLLCDEAQDLCPTQFRFILEMIEPKGCLFVGDVRQSIYGFRNADPKLLMKLIEDEDFTVRTLSQNYRNATTIITESNYLAKKMVGTYDLTPQPMRDIKGKVDFINLADVCRIIKKEPKWDKWAILCRTNKKVDMMMALLEQNNIPCTTFKQGALNNKQLYEAMNSNMVKVLTVHASKGLEFDNVVLTEVRIKSQEDIRVTYVGVTRARDELYIVKNERRR